MLLAQHSLSPLLWWEQPRDIVQDLMFPSAQDVATTTLMNLEFGNEEDCSAHAIVVG